MDHAHGLFMEKMREDLRVHCAKADKDVAAHAAKAAEDVAAHAAKAAEDVAAHAAKAAEDAAAHASKVDKDIQVMREDVATHAARIEKEDAAKAADHARTMVVLQFQKQMAANAQHVSDRGYNDRGRDAKRRREDNRAYSRSRSPSASHSNGGRHNFVRSS
jgi:hypothetical protein